MCAPIGGRRGPVGAHPRRDGVLLKRRRAGVRYDESSLQSSATSCIYRTKSSQGVYLIDHSAFRSAAAVMANSPYQSTFNEDSWITRPAFGSCKN